MTQKLKVFKAKYVENSTIYDAYIVALKKLNEYYTLAIN